MDLSPDRRRGLRRRHGKHPSGHGGRQQILGEPALNFDPAKGPVQAPWLSRGPYIWANGPRPNADGLSYTEGDFGPDGTHPSAAGRQKVAKQLLGFFTTDPTAKSWFVKPE